MQEPTDLALVQATLAGNRAAFGLLVRRYQHVVYALMRKRALDETQAEDLAQDAFIRAFSKLHTYRRNRPFLPWLLKVATNVATSHLRKHKNRPSLELDSPAARRSEKILWSKPDEVHEQVARRELQLKVRRALAELPPKYRQAVALRYLGDLSYAELARTLQVPVGTAKTLVFRAKAKLAKVLERSGSLELPGGFETWSED